MVKRRLGRIQYTPELLVDLARGTYRVVENPLPADARVYTFGADYQTGVFTVWIESEELPELEAGQDPPLLEPPTIERVEE